MTKQFTLLFILVTVFVFAICLVASLAYREATTTYDTSAIAEGLHAIAYKAAIAIEDQEIYMDYWVDEATYEVWGALDATCYECAHAWNVINP